MSERTQNFTGRRWVFQAINDWLAEQEAPRFFLITGEPGSGKTAISCRLYQFSTGEVISPDGMACLKQGFLDAVHFCSSADERWINPKTFIESLAKQLAERYSIYRNALLEKGGDRKVSADIDVSMQNVTAGGDVTGVKISVDLGSASATDGFNRTVREPLEELYRQNPTQQIIILVDALDEALSGKEKETTNIADLITKSQYLPANVRFILTLRPETEKLRTLRRNQLKPEEISLTSGNGLIHTGKDIREHVMMILSIRQDLANKLAPDLPPDIFADTIQRKSEGNFLYVKYLIDMLKDEEKGEKITTESLNNFPNGLDEIYIEFLDRLIKNKGQAVDEYLSVLGILTVSQEALTEGQIANFVQMDKERVRRLLTSLLQLLDTDESIPATQRTYSIYHRSFSEFLLDADRAEDYWCGEQKKHHKRISEFCLSMWRSRYDKDTEAPDISTWDNVHSNYPFYHLSYHLRMSDEHQKLFALVDDSQWYHAQLSIDPTGRTYVNDIENAWLSAEFVNAAAVKAGKLLPFLSREVQCALTIASLYNLSVNISPKLLTALFVNKILTSKQSVAAAELNPDKRKRMQCLLNLASFLPEPLKSNAIHEALVIAKEMEKHNEKLKEDHKWYIEDGLLEFLFQLEPRSGCKDEILYEILDAISEVPTDRRQGWLLVNFSKHLPESIIHQTLDKAVQILWKYDRRIDADFRTQMMIGLSPHISDTVKDKIIQRAVIASRALPKKVRYPPFFENPPTLEYLAPLASHISRSHKDILLQKVLTDVLAVRIGELLTFLVPYLTKEQIKESFDSLLNSEYLLGSSEYIGVLAPYIENESLKNQALHEILQAAITAERYDYFVVTAILKVVPILSKEYIRMAFDTSYRISPDDKYLQYQLLVALARRMASLGEFEEATQIAHEIPIYVPGAWRAKALVSIFEHMHNSSEARSHILKEILDNLNEVAFFLDRTNIILDLAPHLADQQRVNLFTGELARLTESEDNYAQEQVVEMLSPYLSESLLRDALAMMQRPQGMALGNDFSPHYSAAKTMTAMIPYIPINSKTDVLFGIFEASRAIKDDNKRLQSLSELLPFIEDKSLKEQVLREMLQSIKKKGNAFCIPDVAMRLAELLEIHEAIEAARLLDTRPYPYGGYLRIKTLAKISSRMSREQKYNLLNEALENTNLIEHDEVRGESLRCETLIAVVQHIPVHGAERLFKMALNIALTLKDPYSRALALAALARRSRFQSKMEILLGAIDSSLQVRNPKRLRESLTSVFSSIEEQEPHGILYAIQQQLLIRMDLIEYEWIQAEIAIAFALCHSQSVSKMMILKAIQASRAIKDDNKRLQSLSELLPFIEDKSLKEQVLREMLGLAYSFKSFGLKVNALATVSAFIQDQQKKRELLEDSIEAVYEIEIEGEPDEGAYIKNKALMMLAPFITKPLDREILWKQISTLVKSKRSYSWYLALEHIAKHLADAGYYKESLDVAHVIVEENYFDDEYGKSWYRKVLGELIPKLQEPFKSEALYLFLKSMQNKEQKINLYGLTDLKFVSISSSFFIAQIDRAYLYPVWRRILHRMVDLESNDILSRFFDQLTALLPILTNLGGETAVVQTASTINDAIKKLT